MILFAVMEPEEGDAHNVFVDGMLMSPGSEDYNLPPAPELVDHVDRHITPKRELQGYLKFSGLLGASTLSESAIKLFL